MQRCINIGGNEFFGNNDGVFEIITAPGHEGHHDVAPERKFAVFGRVAVGEGLSGLHLLAGFDQDLLVDTGVLVRPLVFYQIIGIKLGKAQNIVDGRCFRLPDNDPRGVDLLDHAGVFGEDHAARIDCRAVLQTGADEGGFR